MNDASNLQDLLIFLVAAVIVVPLFLRFKSSPLLGYVVAGVLIGPHVFGFIRDAERARYLAEFGVMFLLFTIGLELSVGRLWAMRRYMLGIGALQILLSAALISAVALAFGIDPATAIVIGGALSLSSTAFVLRLLTDRGEQTMHYGRVAIAILLLQDLAVVPLLVFVPILGEEQLTVLPALGLAVLEAVVTVTLIVFIGRLLLRPVYRFMAGTGSTELFAAMTLLVVLGTAWLTAQAGLSLALGAFMAGLLLAETEYRHQVEADVRPFRGIFLSLFFISVGMSLDLDVLANRLIEVLFLSLALILGKSVLIGALCRLLGLPSPVSVRVSLLLPQGGEFALIVFASAILAGVIEPPLAQMLMASVVLTMALTPLTDMLGTRLQRILIRRSERELGELSEETEDLTDHVIIAGFGRVGRTVAQFLVTSGIPYVALDLNHGNVASCRSNGMPVFYGDAGNAEVLASAGARRARAVVMTLDQVGVATRTVTTLRHAFPDLPIVVRARDKHHYRELEKSGATEIILETAEPSLQLGAVTLHKLGIESDQVNAVIDAIRADNYASLEESGERSDASED